MNNQRAMNAALAPVDAIVLGASAGGVLPGLVIVPPDYHVLLDVDSGCQHLAGAQDVHLALSDDGLVSYCRPSIDVLFHSASEVFGPRVNGVVLGLQAIKANGGLWSAQSPDEASARTMPEAAIASAQPQFVAPINGIIQLVIALDAHRAGGTEGTVVHGR